MTRRGLLLGSVAALAADGAQPRRRALLIGNSVYRHAASLKNPRNDVAALETWLSGQSFTVTTALDLDKESMETAFDRFADSISAGEAVFILYGGHGFSENGRNFLAPTDLHPCSPIEAAFDSARLWTDPRMQQGATVVFLDACRNSLPDGVCASSRAFGVTRDLQFVAAGGPPATYIAFAAGPGQLSYDNPTGDNSLFMKHVLEGLEAQPYAEIDELIRRVRRGVLEESNGIQSPWTSSTLVDPFHLGAYARAFSSESDAPPVRLVSKRPVRRAESRSIGPAQPYAVINVPRP
ncbi:MAG: hypothetical protein GC160_27325 [Acidobacteria bacterium]|nr:hypothetical protein [Acidobacteriota bacterium]